MAASIFHSAIQTNIAHKLKELEKFRAFTELTVSLNGTDYKPDLCLYPYKKLDWQFDSIREEETPILIVEILSPTQGSLEIMEKTKLFLEAGVKSCWLVTVHTLSVTVYSAIDQFKVFTEGDVIDDSLGISIPLKDIFS